MKKICLIILLALSTGAICAQQLAFPGADGFGKFAIGGRGGAVYHVTNLDDSGPGSLRDAVSQPKRTIVFDVCGVINIKSKLIVSSEITIAGQTAPGAGITVYGDGVTMPNGHDIIIRYLRLRGSINMGKGTCTLAADDAHDIIFDHLSVEWGRWDNLHIKNSKNITVQYCMIGEGIDPQMFGALLERPTNLTVHHCLWIDNQSRNPKAKAGIEYVNNVIYNWGSNGMVGGHSSADNYQDIINNYIIAGPNSSKNFISEFKASDHVYQRGNYVDTNKDGSLNGRLITLEEFKNTTATLETQPHNVAMNPKNIDEAPLAYKKVMAEVGASLQRDAVDNRLLGYLKSLGKTGKIIKNEAEVGGQDKIEPVKAPKDSDGDGIPDTWEKDHQLNPKDGTDANKITSNGYFRLEEYINGLTVRKLK